MTETRPETEGPSLGRLGELEVRLARSKAEIEQAQQLRYEVFYGEMSAVADAATESSRRDDDIFDAICDHLIVVDHNQPAGQEVVATSRLLNAENVEPGVGFYSASEFQIDLMVGRNPGRRFVELGRTCVHRTYRTKRVMELMWHGIWRYVRRFDLDVMIGCGSLQGTDLKELGPTLAALANIRPAPEAWRVPAVAGKGVPLRSLKATSVGQKEALRLMPPLLKGYLRLGAYVGEDAFIDYQFGTTDVLLVLPLEAISARYIRFYGVEASRFAA